LVSVTTSCTLLGVVPDADLAHPALHRGLSVRGEDMRGAVVDQGGET
jgi:hypothetical protein